MPIIEELNRLRTRLLDLSTRNRLLNYRHTKKSSLRVIDETIDLVVDKLLDKDKELLFKSLPTPKPSELENYWLSKGVLLGLDKKEYKLPEEKDWAVYKQINPAYDLPAQEGSVSASHRDNYLQTLHYSEDLEAILRKIINSANTAIQETGTNILYLACGFLEWKEDENSDLIRHAPLLLIPVALTKSDLDKETRTFNYKVSYSGEELLKNISLDFKLQADFGFSIPDLPENVAPETYFRAVEDLLSIHKPTWKVKRHLTLGLFNFGKLLMYLDLDPNKWPAEHNIAEHELVNRLFSGEAGSETALSGQYEEDINIDEREKEDRLMHLVCDADSSQNSCIIDVLDGKNLIIAGPPGTGKSQTITNIISAALFKNKKVLFVSEKMAALEVVRSRLDKLGLGDFCLELHSHKMQKSKLMQDLKQRLGLPRRRFDESVFSEKLTSMFESRDKLSEYAATVNKLHDESDLSVREILARFSKYQDTLKRKAPEGFSRLLEETVCRPVAIKTRNLDKLRELVTKYRGNYQKLSADFSRNPKHDWDFIVRLPFSIEKIGEDEYSEEMPEAEQIAKEITRLKQELLRVQDVITKVRGKIPCLQIDSSDDVVELLAYQVAVASHQSEYSWDIIFDFSSNPQDCFEKHVHSLINLKKASEELGTYLQTSQSFFDNTPTTVKLVNKLNELLDGLVSYIPDSIKISQLLDLEDRIKTLVAKKSILENFDGVIQNYFACWGIKDGSVSEAIEIVLGVFAVLANLPSSGASSVRSMFCTAGRKKLISDFQIKYERLLALKKDLDKVYDLEKVHSNLDFQEILKEFSSAKWWSLCKPAYRQAVKKYNSVLKVASKRNAKLRIPDLESLIAFKEDAKLFLDNEDFNKCFGVLFKGIESSFSEILSLDQWIDQVEQDFYPLCRDRKKYISLIFDLSSNDLISLSKLTAGTFDKQLIDLKDFVSVLRRANLFSEDSHVFRFVREGRFDWPTFFSVLKSYLSPQFFHIDLKILKKILAQHEELMAGFHEIKTKKMYGLSVGSIDEIDNAIRVLSANKEFALLLRERAGSGDIFNHIANLSEIDPLKNFLGLISQLEPAHIGYRKALKEINAYQIDDSGTFHVFASRIDGAINSKSRCEDWLEHLEIKRKLCEMGFDQIVALCEENPQHASLIEEIIFFKIFSDASQAIIRKEPIIKRMADGKIDTLRQKFSDLDNEIMQLNALKIFSELRGIIPPEGSPGPRVKDKTEMSLIRHQVELTRKHIPIRGLISRAAKALQAVKPCFIMSPMSLAQYLPPGQISFDLVVMDEASQIKPEEALSAIARGSQVVIVGDTCQLPPTSFFDRVSADEMDDNLSGLEDAESILEIASSAFYRDKRMLRWHYRSKHESLISFSNRFFYDNKLVLFPSPNIKSDTSGIVFNYVKGTYKESVNVKEAKEVVLAVKKNILENPAQSIGLVAMNVKQQEALEIELENLLKEDGEFEAVFAKYQQKVTENIFIKNLESVQGDERDVIFISMTYGPDEAGNVMQRFGPVNMSNGWRRLNVLFTRARHKVSVFSSMKSMDILVDHGSSRGVRALKDYLQFAETGILPMDTTTMVNPDRPDAPEVNFFEQDIMNEIKNMGYVCDPQIGVSEYFIDIGIRDTNNPNKYMVGIECDGATYHSAKSARDRDRLRQKILEGLGWKIYRIWSTDWFKSRGQQLNKLRAALSSLSNL